MSRCFLAISIGILCASQWGCGALGGSSSSGLPRARPADDDEPAPATAAAGKAAPGKPGSGQVAAAQAAAKDSTPKAEELIHKDPEGHRRTLAINRLRTLAQALENFKKRYEFYPDQSPPQGKLSWRVTLLPFLGRRDLFQKFRLQEPWDSDHNRALLKEIPDVYLSDRRDEKTNVLLITGPGTAYPGKSGLTDGGCPDGLDNTLLVAEVADHLAKPWTQPEDYVFDRATAQRDLFGLRKDCCFVVVGGGLGARRMSARVADADLLAVLSPNGREPRSAKDVTAYPYPEIDAALIAELERSPLPRFVEAKKPPPPAKAGTATSTNPPPPVAKEQPALPRDARLPVPDDKALAAATATAKELYKADYEAAKKPGEKRALAKKLLGLAGKVSSDSAGMYVLLRDARDLGAPAGDIDTALAAADKLGKTFRLDPLPLKLKSLEQAAPAIESLAEAGKLFAKSLELETELLEHDDLDGAKRALAVAMSAARRSNKREPVDQVTARKEKLEESKRAFDRVSGALLTLLRSPDDPAANGAVGRYLCLVRENWTRGLPLLARGDDEQLGGLAAADLKNPTTAEEQAALADRWWAWSEKLSSQERRSARSRAAHWYKQALPGLPASLTSERAKQRIADAAEKDGPRTKQTGNAAKTRSNAAG
jgi:hypothetical protein